MLCILVSDILPVDIWRNMPRNLVAGPWSALHHRVLYMTLKGRKAREIAKRVGMSQHWVEDVRHLEEFKVRKERALRSIIEQIQEIFESKGKMAARNVIRIAKSGVVGDRVQLDASKDILDRIGYKPVQIIETRQRLYSPAEIESAKGTVQELEDTIMRLERKDSIYILKKKCEVPPELQPVEDAEPSGSTSTDRPQTMST